MKKFSVLIITLCVMIACFCACTTAETVDKDLEQFLFNYECITEEDHFRTMMTDKFDQAYGNSDNVESILIFRDGVYSYYDAENKTIKTIPLSAKLIEWWNNYGSIESTNDYRRPLPNIYFDGKQFDMMLVSMPCNVSEEEFQQIPADDKLQVKEEVVYEFLMRTYGIRQDMIDEIVYQRTCENIFSERLQGMVPVQVNYLWFKTTDGSVSKLNIVEAPVCYDGDNKYYIGFYTGTEEVGLLDMYPWY